MHYNHTKLSRCACQFQRSAKSRDLLRPSMANLCETMRVLQWKRPVSCEMHGICPESLFLMLRKGVRTIQTMFSPPPIPDPYPPPPKNLLNLVCLSVFVGNIGNKTPKPRNFGICSLPYEDTQNMDLVNLGDGGGVHIWLLFELIRSKRFCAKCPAHQHASRQPQVCVFPTCSQVLFLIIL